MAGWVAVTVEDITKRWRPLTTNEATIAPELIQDAQDMLEEALEELNIFGVPVPDPDGRWARKYTRTVAAMVKRVLSNLEGFLSEKIDDYEYRRDKAVSSGELYISDSELNKFRRLQRRRGAFTITPS